jgi:hypothetical protein
MASAAWAAPGEAGSFALSIDRAMGIVSTSQTFEPDGGGPDVDTDTLEVGFLLSGQSPFSTSRVAFDVFPIDGLSLGGSVGYLSTTVEDDAGGETTDSAFLFGPRVGYLVMFSDLFGIWPRGGFTYLMGEFEDTTIAGLDVDTEYGLFALTAEVPIVLAPAEGFAILLGPTLDLSLTGSAEATSALGSADGDLSVVAFGLQAGLAAVF